jgi:hypothetical protein
LGSTSGIKKKEERRRGGAERENRTFVGTTALGWTGWWFDDLTK